VNGSKSAPVYNFLKAQKSGIVGSRIKWNFTKFLVDEEGHVINRYSPTTKPLAIEVSNIYFLSFMEGDNQLIFNFLLFF